MATTWGGRNGEESEVTPQTGQSYLTSFCMDFMVAQRLGSERVHAFRFSSSD